jgi:putative SOS response-associated peptidase YedK
MCFHTKQTKTAQELKHRFKALFEYEELYEATEVNNGFTYSHSPVITHQNPNQIRLYNWGLIPDWAKDNTIRQYTLNAQIETLKEKPSFKNSIQNRCLILIDGFYEWKWMDPKGKIKQKYLLHQDNNEAFVLGGLWNESYLTKEIVKTFTIVTTPANQLMSEIHNVKKRMPLVLNDELSKLWLDGINTKEFINQAEDIIQATKI